MMTKRDFEMIADTIYEQFDELGIDDDRRERFARALSIGLRESNSRFDRDRFLDRVATGSKRYAIVENTPGYLPESDPILCASRAEAESIAHSIAMDYRMDGYRVTGSARDGRYDIADPEKTYDLGRVVEIIDRTRI